MKRKTNSPLDDIDYCNHVILILLVRLGGNIVITQKDIDEIAGHFTLCKFDPSNNFILQHVPPKVN